ncbi:hypothetical protein BX600DRAFT_500930 [Xylariales sp. PMI_506]|nr:hypothetical protein BX600DRAFT_500930 [Xylariales sp. PMI_506]
MGRPPASGYCHTCRKRRVKCDRKTPACTRCTKLGVKCDGYEIPLRIESYGVMSQPNGVSHLTKISKATSFPMIAKWRLETLRDRTAVDFLLQSSWGMIFLGPVMHRCASGEFGEMAKQCCLAISLGLLANTSEDADMRLKAWALYGKQLREVSRLLSRQEPVDIAPLIGPVMILGGYTVWVNSYLNSTISISHRLCAQLIIVFAYDRFLSQGMGRMCTIKRGWRVFWSIADQKHIRPPLTFLSSNAAEHFWRTFLQQDCWINAPWRTQQKDRSQHLVDILAHLPGLLEDTDVARHLNEQDSEGLRAQVDGLRETLDLWRLDWEVHHANAVVEIQSSQPGYDIDYPLFKHFGGSKLRYKNIKLAVEMILYNAVLLWLMKLHDIVQNASPENCFLSLQDLEVICRETEIQQDNDCNSSPLLLPHQVHFFCQPALEIIRSVAFVFEQIGLSGCKVETTLAPIGIAYRALREFSPLATWLEMELAESEPIEGLTQLVLWVEPAPAMKLVPGKCESTDEELDYIE